MTTNPTIALEESGHYAEIDTDSYAVKYFQNAEGVRSVGFGYIKKIKGKSILIALFVQSRKLFLFVERPYLLNQPGNHAKLKEGLFRSRFIFWENKTKKIDIRYRASSYGADVLELCADAFKEPSKKEKNLAILANSIAESR